jgi:hypothetical protein
MVMQPLPRRMQPENTAVADTNYKQQTRVENTNKVVHFNHHLLA